MRILVVDDDLSIARGLGRVLRQGGHEVSIAGDGNEALSVARSINPDLVLSDIDLPGRDGLALFDALHREAPELDVILMTGTTKVENAVVAMRNGATDYLLKPFANEELVARVATIAERRALRTELKTAREALSQQLGPYVLGAKIGSGGMGVVCEASHSMLRRPTAVKLLRGELMSPQALARFEREVQVTCRLTHPNTISVYDYGRTSEGIFYYAMELLGGASVAEVVRHTGPMPPARVLHVLRGACGSLVEAHGKGLVHRDVKPNNIQLCERGGVHDTPKVLDFGLVLELHDPGAPENHIVGTPGYLAPECVRNPSDVTPLVDIYALGCVAYFMLAGQAPFTGPHIFDILRAQSVRPAPLRKVPKALEQLVLACIAPNPNKRPRTMQAVLDRVEAIKLPRPWTRKDAERYWTAHEQTIATERRNTITRPVGRTVPSPA